jgi:ribose 5-phosphate isomerase A
MSHDIEESKRLAAIQAVQENFPRDPHFVGIGSGTTIVYVVQAIVALQQDVSRVCFVPTGYQSRQLIIDGGLIPIQFDALPENAVLDICFDGADEVDEDLNCIKGGGACLFQEKLVAMRSKKFICVAGQKNPCFRNPSLPCTRSTDMPPDHRKLQSRLLTSWPSIPIEVAPIAARQVLSRLRELGSLSPLLREGHIPKAGPLKTDQDFFIIDAPFPRLLTSSDLTPIQDGRGKDGLWEVEHLANAIKSIEGVLEVGIFSGRTGPEAMESGTVGGQRPVACYFGMADGSVTVRKASPRKDDIKQTLEFEAKPAS